MVKIHLRPLPKAKGLRSNKFGVFDIETWGLAPKRFALGCAVWYDGVEVHREQFKDPDDMRIFLFENRDFRGYTWYGHNVEYDLLGIMDNPLKFFKPCIYSQSQFILGVRYLSEKNTVRVCDSHNLFKTSVAELGKCLGFPKGKTPEKFIKGIKCKITQEDFDYCMQDCMIVFKMVDNFRKWIFQEYNCNIGVTIASTALKVFQTNWGIDTYVDEVPNEAFRKAYYGGRCEVFRKGTFKGPLYYYDVNSLYPYTYSTLRFPDAGKMRKTRGTKNFKFIIGNERYEGVAHVRLETQNDIPILPVKHGGKLLFPKGEISGWYCFPEIRFALSRGYRLIEAYDTYYSVGIPSPFKEYASAIYAKRKACKESGDLAGSIYTKYLLNSLYGKFGEVRECKTWGTWDEPIAGMVFDEVRDGYGYWRDPNVKTEYTDHTIFGICAYVTAGARVLLYRHLEKCKTVYYCDTDSIVTETVLDTSGDLGDLKLEETLKSITILHPKCYEMQTETGSQMKIKGIPKGDLPNDIRASKIPVHRYTKSKESIRRGVTAGEGLLVEKSNNWQEHDKRIFETSGSSRPFTCSMINGVVVIDEID